MTKPNHNFATEDTDFKSVFLHKLRHDLLNTARPLVEVPNWIEEDIAEGDVEMPAQLKEHFDMLRIYGNRMYQMIEDLLIFAHVGQSPDQENEPLSSILNDLVDGVLPASFTIVREIEEENTPIPSYDLRSYLDAVLSNSVKHHDRDHGEIKIVSKRIDGVFYLVIADDGPGLANGDLDRIFSPLTTLASRDDREGSGMGLAIARRIVGRYGGFVKALSTEQKRGLGIVAWFP